MARSVVTSRGSGEAAACPPPRSLPCRAARRPFEDPGQVAAHIGDIAAPAAWSEPQGGIDEGDIVRAAPGQRYDESEQN